MVTKIISGAQTGADQGGLYGAEDAGLDTGGYVPLNRRTEAGPLSMELFRRWKLRETRIWGYNHRTEKNVAESDGTVIFGDLRSPGSISTMKFCDKWHKHYIGNPVSPEALAQWCKEHNISVLNVAGNRESKNPGICVRVRTFIGAAFRRAA